MVSVNGYMRLAVIQDLLEERGQVRVKDLMAELRVSYPTVARDLAELEARSAIRRVRGGAVSPESGDVLGAPFREPRATRRGTRRCHDPDGAPQAAGSPGYGDTWDLPNAGDAVVAAAGRASTLLRGWRQVAS